MKIIINKMLKYIICILFIVLFYASCNKSVNHHEKKIGYQLEKKGVFVLYDEYEQIRIIQCYNPDKQIINLSDRDYEAIGILNNIRELSLCINPLGERTIFSDKNLEAISNLKRLNSLNLINTSITDKGIKYICRMKSLKTLYLTGTKITDNGIKELKVLKNLTKIELSKTGVTNIGVNELKKELPNCRITWK